MLCSSGAPQPSSEEAGLGAYVNLSYAEPRAETRDSLVYRRLLELAKPPLRGEVDRLHDLSVLLVRHELCPQRLKLCVQQTARRCQRDEQRVSLPRAYPPFQLAVRGGSAPR